MKEQDKQTKKGSHITLISILGGDFLAHDFLRRQAGLFFLIFFLSLGYVANRYASQQEIIEIDSLKKTLIDIKYDALTISSELTEKSRQSRIEKYISDKGTPLKTAATPPYLIKE